ncbi:MAG: guanylate kinase [Candidatus Omnitrophica bacterium]|nr:guanylate kinase [Candidatus Omnitrophota bacterium]MDD5670982.1 guanylate kinase [Candidatus Omnitrophota bacterium]
MSSKGKQVQKGVLVLFSSPSGGGKTTIVDRLLKRHPDWVRSVSMTTRAARAGEKNGEDYFFVTKPEFEKMKADNGFLEYANVFDCEYGTPRPFVEKQVESGKTVVLAIDVQGMKKIKQAVGGKISLLSIFILPPSLKILRDRLEGRNTDTPEDIERRLDIAQEEIKQANCYDCTVVNQNLEDTVLEIDEIVNKFLKERR